MTPRRLGISTLQLYTSIPNLFNRRDLTRTIPLSRSSNSFWDTDHEDAFDSVAYSVEADGAPLEVGELTARQTELMPFQSEAQRRYLFANEPKIAHAWAHGRHSAKKHHRMPKRKSSR